MMKSRVWPCDQVADVEKGKMAQDEEVKKQRSVVRWIIYMDNDVTSNKTRH